jgi:hypothetical protein
MEETCAFYREPPGAGLSYSEVGADTVEDGSPALRLDDSRELSHTVFVRTAKERRTSWFWSARGVLAVAAVVNALLLLGIAFQRCGPAALGDEARVEAGSVHPLPAPLVRRSRASEAPLAPRYGLRTEPLAPHPSELSRGRTEPDGIRYEGVGVPDADEILSAAYRAHRPRADRW